MAIHAAKRKWNPANEHPDLVRRVRELKLDHSFMPYGAILGIITVTGCRKVEDLLADLSSDDLLFGNYDSICPTCAGYRCEKCEMTGRIQRYGWVTDPEKLLILKTPIPVRGSQQIFSWTIPEGVEFK
jgi:hypothetical protein